MMRIPKRLQDDRLRFCRIKQGTKKPFEKDWTNKPHTWQDIKEQKNENYGVLCGYGNLAVIDCDVDLLCKHIERFLPKTYEVKTGSGKKHFYYFIEGMDSKIILFDGDTHLGEVQSKGTQVVGPGSIHPNGKPYEELEDREIASISFNELIDVVKPFMKEIKQMEENLFQERKDNNEIDDLNVASIWGTAGLKSKDGEYFGPHPIHGSDGGQNFWINNSKNVWHCFRCNSGGGPLSAIAVKEGLIDCSDATRGKIRGSLAKKCIDIAKGKYGLKQTLRSLVSANFDVFANDEERQDFSLIWEKDLDDYKENKSWLIEGLIPSRSVGIWTGKRSTFKTFLVLDASISVSRGEKFLDFNTEKGGVIYLDKENGLHEIKKRVKMLKKGKGINEPLDMGFICFSTLKIDKITDIGRIEELIKEHKPALLVVDTYRRGISFEENDAGAVSALFVDILRPLVEKYNFSMVLIHHDRKGGGQGDEMDEIRGSSDLVNYADFVLKNDRKGEKIILKQLKNRNAPEIKPRVIKINTDDLTSMSFEASELEEAQSREEQCAKILTDWMISHKIKTFTTREAQDVAFTAGVKKNNFHNGLILLEQKGIIEKQLRGIYGVVSLEF